MRIRSHSGNRPVSSRSGISLLELLLVAGILTVALGEFTRTLVSVARLDPINRDSAKVKDQALSVFETMRSLTFEELVVRYNAIDADNPVLGPSPGQQFDVPLLQAQGADVDGRVGRVTLPMIGNAVREDYIDEAMGMPRDLNGDGMIDALDHSADYMILPVRLDIAWMGQGGDRALTFHSVLTSPR